VLRFDVGIPLLCYTRGRHSKPMPLAGTKQREYAQSLAERGNDNVLTHLSSIRRLFMTTTGVADVREVQVGRTTHPKDEALGSGYHLAA